MIPDYYKILGVPRNATDQEIRRAFRRLSLQYHPDVNKSQDAHERFLLTKQAYETLIDPERRREYDRHLSFRRDMSMAIWQMRRFFGRPVRAIVLDILSTLAFALFYWFPMALSFFSLGLAILVIFLTIITGDVRDHLDFVGFLFMWFLGARLVCLVYRYTLGKHNPVVKKIFLC